MNAFTEKLRNALHDDSFVRLLLTPPPTADGPRKIIGRLVQLKTGPHLSLTLRHDTRDTTRNLPVPEVEAWLATQPIQSALLNTTRADWQWAGGKLIRHKPRITTPPARHHDQPAHTVLDKSAADWLQPLGLLNAQGQVRPAGQDKFQQINRYLEIFGQLAAETDLGRAPVIADMGCGKAYLTFGLWHLFARVWNKPVHLLGIESRPELVQAAQQLASQIGATGLEFKAGDIATTPLPPLSALIALHACNTATDLAIRRGLKLGAKLIIVAPCCHQQLRPQLDSAIRASAPAALAPLVPALQHGLLAERLTEWATDAYRSLYLEWAGYRVKLLEFVASEHTPKNLMIAAVRTREPFTDPAAKQRLDQFRQALGIQQHGLD